MKNTKKEDQEYLDSMLEKHNISTKYDNEYYRKLDNTILQWCPFVLILFIILSILWSSIVGSNKQIISFFIFTVIFIFAVLYIIFSFLFWIVELLSKKTKNYKFNLIVKLSISIILAILITYTVSTPICAGCGGSTPTIATTQLLKSLIDNPGAESCTYPVTFTRSKSTLSAESITRDTGLEPEQVYFANPEDIVNFDAIDSQLLKYTATSSKKVAICAICSQDGKTGLEQALQENGISNTTINSIIEGETICAVYPRKSAN